MNNKLIQIIKSEYQVRVIDECLVRIKQCLNTLNSGEIWLRQNPNTNSVGNLVLHLSGNIRQYIISGVGGAEDTRIRDMEFETSRNETRAFLIDLLDQTLVESNTVVQTLSDVEFIQEVTIQGFEHTRLSAIIHVIEHLSYHTGQITYFTKFIKDIDTAYYGGLDLNVTS